jgi:hypothetical protein
MVQSPLLHTPTFLAFPLILQIISKLPVRKKTTPRLLPRFTFSLPPLTFLVPFGRAYSHSS